MGCSLEYSPREVSRLGLGEPLSLGQDSCRFPSSCLDHTGQERERAEQPRLWGFLEWKREAFVCCPEDLDFQRPG